MKVTKLILAVFVLMFIWAGDLPDKKHLGLWKGYDGKDSAYFHFHKDRFFSMIMGGDTVDGHSILWDNQEEMCIKHLTNYSKNPHEIDIVIYFKENMLEISRSKGIFKFDSLNQMHVIIDFSEKSRPAKFKKRKTMVFEKVE